MVSFVVSIIAKGTNGSGQHQVIAVTHTHTHIYIPHKKNPNNQSLLPFVGALFTLFCLLTQSVFRILRFPFAVSFLFLLFLHRIFLFKQFIDLLDWLGVTQSKAYIVSAFGKCDDNSKPFNNIIPPLCGEEKMWKIASRLLILCEWIR